MDSAIGTLQVDKEAAFTPKLGKVRPLDIISLERRETDGKIVNDLEKAVDRDGSYLHPPAVRDEGEGRYRLIHGHHRVVAWKRCRGEQTPITVNIYPPHTSDALIELLETEENLFRKELTAAERTAQEMRWVAASKKLNGGKPVTPVSGSGEAAESGNLIPSLAPARGGRGNKGMAQRVAEKLGSGKRAVNMRLDKASEAIGEKIDLDYDTPEELERKAAELEKADKRQRAEPKGQRPKHRERAPQEVVDDSGEIDSEIEEVWRAFSALSERKQLKIMLRACRLRGWTLRMGRARRVPAVDEEPAVALPLKAAPATYDTAMDSHPEQQEGGADVSADDLQHPGDAVSQAADQEPELAVDLPTEVAPATDAVAVKPQLEQQGDGADVSAEGLQVAGDAELPVELPAEVELAIGDPVVRPEERDDAVDLGAEDLQVADDEAEDTDAGSDDLASEHADDDAAEDANDEVSEAVYQGGSGAKGLQAADDVGEAPDQEHGGATKCAYCGEGFSSTDPSVMKDGRLLHRNKCVGWAKPIAIAA